MKFILPILTSIQRWLLAALFFFFSLVSSSQTNISGVVNTYRSVIEIIPAKACIRVNNITGISVNKKIMVVQMKGAAINTTNTASFGDTISTNDAGFYDIGTICAIRDDSVFLFHNLVNNYNTATGKVQLVVFAEYLSANVVDTVKAQPWNIATGTGGVIALYADLDITLNAPVYANSSGYRGGQFVQSNGTCSNIVPATGYAYPGANSSPQNGAYKGEGIADIGTTQNGGRGAPANGGGGGNNHNNSGGGGANLSAGGAGGGNSSTSGCSSTLKGLGGKPLSGWNGKKIFAGGGGGAGQNNNGLLTNGGGNGGGIIFIWANTIIGNNNIISASGGNGGASLSDGAGGGGGGGTIILHVSNYTGNLTVQANGGNGGNSEDGGNIDRCYGGGGGGSGGVLYFTGALPAITTSVAAGSAGVETGRDPGCAVAQPASAGSGGAVISSYTFTRSTAAASYCTLVLPSKLIFFKAFEQGKKVILGWQVLNPELVTHFTIEKKDDAGNWIEMMTVPAVNNTESYSLADTNPHTGENYYRLRITEKSTTVYYSNILRVVRIISVNEFSCYPNPATHSFTVYRNTNGIADLRLNDMTGKIVLQQKIWSKVEEILLPQLPAGIYLVRVNQSIKKIVIR